jgi:hypothetical protein
MDNINKCRYCPRKRIAAPMNHILIFSAILDMRIVGSVSTIPRVKTVFKGPSGEFMH